jgi:type IV pilus assembly protein PilW
MTGGHQRGLTMVELLVGMALGLFVISAALLLLMSRIQAHRAELLEARLMQDLRVAIDVVTRDLRRAGYWNDAATVMAGSASAASANPYAAITPASGSSETIRFSYSRDLQERRGVDGNEQFGFRLRRGAIEMLLGGGNWQALTDSNTIMVTAFSISPALQEIGLDALCAQSCSEGEDDCRPRQVVRSLAVSISGHAAGRPRVLRSLRTLVRLRNDAIAGACRT